MKEPKNFPRSDAKLKTLPQERQQSIFEKLCLPITLGGGFSNTLKWLRDDGFSTSFGALSEFRNWYAVQEQLTRNESTVTTLLEDLKRGNPGLNVTELEAAGQLFFSALAIEQKDSLTWKRIQDAKLKLGVLQLSREKFQRDTIGLFLKWYENKEAKRIASSNVPTAEKTEKLGQHIFGELWQ